LEKTDKKRQRAIININFNRRYKGASMKKFLKASAAVLLVFAGFQTNAAAQDNGEKIFAGKKVLAAYYSHSGTTKEIAKQIQAYIGCDIFEIQTLNPYPENRGNLLKEAKKEIENGYKPELKTKINVKDYEIIFIGSPNWWGTIAPAVSSFLASSDFSGKIVIPFNTNGGGGAQRCFEDVKKLLPKSTVLEGRAFSLRNAASQTKEIYDWISKIVLNK
jgi:flavodoxin